MDSKRLKKKKPKWLLPVIVVIIGVIVATILLLVWRYADDVFVLVPGYYENRGYNSLTADKNDLIDENAVLLAENDGYEQDILTLGSSVEDYEQMVNLNDSVLSNLDVVAANLETIIGFDNDFNAMRLPTVVATYVDLSLELDQVRKDMVVVSVDITTARRDMSEFNLTRAKFDACLKVVTKAERSYLLAQ